MDINEIANDPAFKKAVKADSRLSGLVEFSKQAISQLPDANKYPDDDIHFMFFIKISDNLEGYYSMEDRLKKNPSLVFCKRLKNGQMEWYYKGLFYG